MAVLPILISGAPILHSAAVAVTEFDAELRTLIDDMFETMDTAPGVGLAAPQVGVGLRLFVYDFPEEDETPRRGAVINPMLWLSPALPGAAVEDDESEGCLSFPGERFPLRRAERAILHAVDEHNVAFTLEAEGWFARILQHETDHLDGFLYTDRLEHPHQKGATKVVRKNGWGVPGVFWLPGVDDLEA